MVTRHLLIAGRVQGVGFRDALCDEAKKNGVTGWVRNCRDGRVEAVLQGSPAAIEATIGWARRGPPTALVASVEVGAPPAAHDRRYSRFELWPTA
jgi:acylphosphatase